MRFTALVIVILLSACVHAPAEGDNPIDPNAIRAHMAFLSDDLLEGREAGTRGEALAALYIQNQFSAAGLQPGGDDGYLQRFRVRATRLDLPSVDFRVRTARGVQRFRNGAEIATYGTPDAADERIEGALVFAGYGIDAPGRNDYAGLDVTGKIVVVLGGPPPYMNSAEAAHYGTTLTQRQTAHAKGAIGLIVLWTPALEARWPFAQFESILGRTELDWIDAHGRPGGDGAAAPIIAWANGAAADALLDGAPATLEQLVAQAATGPVRGFALRSEVTFHRRSHHDDSLSATNVIGVLRGSDPVLADELVVVTAHYDHVGIGAPVNGDAIYNGAGDNALGVAAIIEIARAMQARERPARSIVFAAVGAEEKGLIGSDYFAANPSVAGRMVANINIDGGLIFYDFSDVIAFGAEHTQMCERVADAADELGLTLAPDPFPEQGFFTRSDQYSFMRRGVPGIFLFPGFTDMSGANVGRGIWDSIDFVHQPNDDMSQPWDFEVGAKFADVGRRIALRVARGPAPLWYADSSLSAPFAPNAARAARPTGPPCA